MRRINFFAVVTIIALGLGGCATVPIYNVTDASTTSASGKALQASQVRQAIITAGGKLGWRIVDAGPGRLEGTLDLRTHSAVVDIPYSASKYSIQFLRGVNLKATDGSIHKNYNGWIQNLERDIRIELARQ